MLLVFCGLITTFLFTFGCGNNEATSCTIFKDCNTCLKISNCVWCRDMIGQGKSSQCISREDSSVKCRSPLLVEDNLLTVILSQNKPLTTGSPHRPILLRPQKVNVYNVREGNVFNVTVTFRQAVDYPVDLYFLMDASRSMEPIKRDLAKMSDKMAERLFNLTKKVSFGFGTFVDKNTPPFALENQNPYTFKHILELTPNITQFKEIVNNTNVTTNFDVPESALDAVLQAAVCFEEIRWRTVARKIIIVATNAPTHVAGDGKVAGITKPNNGRCHLENGTYSMALEQDYASFGLIARKVKEQSMNLIFAVKHTNPYSGLASLVKDSVRVVALNSTSLANLVEKQYREIANSVQLRHNDSEFVKLYYFSSCLDGYETERNECEELRIDKEINFTVSVKVKKCPLKIADRKQTLVVEAYGYQDTLTLDIDINCYCPCEKSDNTSCPSRCSELKYCVNCAEKSFQNDSECDKCNYHAEFILEREPLKVSSASDRICDPIHSVQTGCAIEYLYGFDNKVNRILVRYYISNEGCPGSFPLALASLSLMGGIVAIGIAIILMWRCLLFLYDRKEYARFIEESKNAKWTTGANPLYIGVCTTTQNPAFKNTLQD